MTAYRLRKLNLEEKKTAHCFTASRLEVITLVSGMRGEAQHSAGRRGRGRAINNVGLRDSTVQTLAP